MSPLSTMSKIGAGKSPGGSPLKTMVPPRRAIPMACPKADGCTAVTSTPWAPPVTRWIASIGSSSSALTVSSAPWVRASASLSSAMSTAATRSPIATAYCTAMWPRPPMPEMTTHSPGRASVILRPLYTVTPAQRRGATSIGSEPVGMRAANFASTSMYSPKDPSTL